MSDTSMALKRLDEDEKVTLRLTQGESKKTSETTIVSEPGLYSLIGGSRKPEAKLFMRWATYEIFPIFPILHILTSRRKRKKNPAM